MDFSADKGARAETSQRAFVSAAPDFDERPHRLWSEANMDLQPLVGQPQTLRLRMQPVFRIRGRTSLRAVHPLRTRHTSSLSGQSRTAGNSAHPASRTCRTWGMLPLEAEEAGCRSRLAAFRPEADHRDRRRRHGGYRRGSRGDGLPSFHAADYRKIPRVHPLETHNRTKVNPQGVFHNRELIRQSSVRRWQRPTSLFLFHDGM